MTAVPCEVGVLAHPRGSRRFPVGAEVQTGGIGVSFRVWAPRRRTVSLVVLDAVTREVAFEQELSSEGNGYWWVHCDGAGAGTLYFFRLEDEESLCADPASRFQPEGPHGPSMVVNPAAFDWTDADWRGPRLRGQVLYELHIGTFTQQGTWAGAREQLEELADLGITLLEIMPVADFHGHFGWGYDGVNLFAPTRLYGTPDDFRAFIDQAHALGMGVILDVVYNHVGIEGNVLPRFSESYFSTRHATDWGRAINFDEADSGPVREFYLANAAYWIEEFHLDGLRIDATQNIYDESAEHILAAVTKEARRAAGDRSIIIVAENEPQEVDLVRPAEQGGMGMDALWNDDFHHSAMVLLSGHNEAYYTDYLGKPQEFISAVKRGYLYQGQWYEWQQQRRGKPTRGVPPEAFVNFLQNHDQVANSGQGLRFHLLSSPGRCRAMTALLLLAPNTPMLFQGQEFAASSPFYYFADYGDQVARKVGEGRKKFMAQFPSIASPEIQAMLPDPADPATFIRSKLDFHERLTNAHVYRLHRDLLRLRREDPVLNLPRGAGLDGAVLGDEAFVLRFFADDETLDRLLIVNFGRDLPLRPCPEPLLAPPSGSRWAVLWSSEDPQYGGLGTPPLDTPTQNWRLPGHAAALLHAVPFGTNRLDGGERTCQV